ncbi:serine hydrolase [Halomonas heilongjiangensis]|uniref:Serine hydrolase n=1 Tax=Halomonas heilongjiangensis TaxID=1387883 RepID=A0A2N7TK12_9GAMM|nr:serine hydrolase [Halomonas heilongjiangensis]PMR68527.1 serine hydrolase [Halomonas heilongjiangensis]PXX86686.1 serine hydrolase [Halomonas heilongjiangensis]
MRALVLGLALLVLPLPAMAEPAWSARLEAKLAALEAGFDGELGVVVRPLGSDERFGWRADESWYLASLIKVPVAIELMARVEAGEAALDERLVLHESDYVDGAGPTNWAPPGAELTLHQLLVAMLTVSDNTASDMLIRRLGLEAVNRRAQALAPGGESLGPITSLVDVRRHVYGGLHPRAVSLSGLDFIELRKRPSDAARLDWLARRLEVPHEALRWRSLDDAFAAYYATDLNSGRLDAFAELLAALGEGRALGPAATARLLSVMERTTSGERRLKAGLGPGVRFAHKTGTQHRRSCDAGIATLADGAGSHRVAIVACARGELNLARNEQVLAAVGRAIREVGPLAASF